MKASHEVANPDVILVGAGIMSATLGILLKELDPSLTIEIFERLDVVAAESSDAWNNAGTGHSALCELNYTPQMPDGTVDISKALHITESFEVSKQFWSYLVTNNVISSPRSFINSIPHMSCVWGEENVAYLQKRFEAMKTHHFYSKMQYAEDKEQLKSWVPLMMQDRDGAQKLAATKIDIGTDVNFGNLTRSLFGTLEKMNGVTLHLNHEVDHIKKEDDGQWHIKVKERHVHGHKELKAKFVFIGAGGGALLLLEKAGLPEAKGFGGFPVSGQWLTCKDRNVVEAHHAKVYGKASVGTPPMSVPHLVTRVIDNKHELLFGPFAGFYTKFLKHGSLMDLPLSIRAGNIAPMLATGAHNIPLIKYLVKQVIQSPQDRLNALREFIPDAKMEDWELREAGQRVQVIKKDEKEIGILEFGTEVVSASDGSLAALLGASPGASTSVSIMLGLVEKCFKQRVATPEWQAKLKEMIPSYGKSLANDAALTETVRAHTTEVLQLHNVEA